MFAQVYPLKRLPRRFTCFDYLVPDTLTVTPGDVVMAPLKGRPTLCVVGRTQQTTTVNRVLPIERIVLPQFFTPADLTRYERIAERIAQSVSTVLFATLPSIPKREPVTRFMSTDRTLSIDRETALFIQSTLACVTDRAYLQLGPEGEYALATVLRKKHQGQMFILVPRERDALLLAQRLALGPVAVLHGKTAAAQRYAIARDWQNGTIRTLIGTRQAALLAANKLDVVHVMDVSSEDYRHLDRNPRVDARNAAELLAKQHHAMYITSGLTPRLSVVGEKTSFWQNDTPVELISLKAQEEQTGHPFISETLMKAMSEALQNRKSVLLSFNRKGVAKRLQCKNCGHIPFCAGCKNVPIVREHDLLCGVCHAEMWIPKTCPACGSPKLSQKGAGNRNIQLFLKKAFPNKTIGIIEKNGTNANADILIVTEYYFKQVYTPFLPKTFDVVADLCVDFTLGGNDFRSSEIAAYKFQRLVSLARQQKATCIAQTWMPDLTAPLQNVQKFLAHEAELRTTYKLAPSVHMATVRCSKDQKEYVRLTDEEQKRLQNLPDTCIIETDYSTYDT